MTRVKKAIKRLLILVDLQIDFITGSLGTKEAQKIISYIVEKIKNWNGDVLCTEDTHDENYLSTAEGRNLPVEHCIKNTLGHAIHPDIKTALHHIYGTSHSVTFLHKDTFGSLKLAQLLQENDYDYIEIVGLCTDICVVYNALILKTALPETEIVVDERGCAGTTVQKHKEAISVMESCQIKILKNKV